MLKSRVYLHEHERNVILADLQTIGGYGSWVDFERHFPGRYDPRYFDTAMERLKPTWVSYRGRSRLFGAKVWCARNYVDPPPAHQKEGGPVIDPKDPDASLKMMKMPDAWPLGHVLPLERQVPHTVKIEQHDMLSFDTIRGGQVMEFGVLMLHGDIPRWRVHRLNVHDIRLRELVMTARTPDTVTTYDYDSAEEVERDGWKVN